MRFIPTPVGNISLPCLNRRNRAVHPHACGEHLVLRLMKFIPAGSSPRLWGTYGRLQDTAVIGRFIPTPVGNMLQKWRVSACDPVHPHACGEHISLWVQYRSVIGSSPRLWGTSEFIPFPGPAPRFIPTPVGNMPYCSIRCAIFAVHPHACGEHTLQECQAVPAIGSSPRLWGTFKIDRCAAGSPRFIPTPVGNIQHSSPIASLWPVHPHACGEH